MNSPTKTALWPLKTIWKWVVGLVERRLFNDAVVVI
jgi:hypothetical protein